MRYLMTQKLFSLAEDFTVQDDAGNDAFVIKGKVFSIGAKAYIFDLAGNELAFIRQKVWTWRPTYEILRSDVTQAVVLGKLFTLFRPTFTVQVAGSDDLLIEGNFLQHEYTITRGMTPVATISKQWFTLRETYGVDVAQGEDPVMLLACTVAVDRAAHRRRRRD